jgi:vanillate O-demethylase ferredoxin subunit
MREEQELRLARVSAVRTVAKDILAYDLVPADRRPFAPYEPGAHIDVHVPNGLVRPYSLCGDPAQPKRYTIAVKLEEGGRGGSASMHRGAEAGVALGIEGPRNYFALQPGEDRTTLIAGGIGITPIYAMAQWLAANGRTWELHYCARSAQHAAFVAELEALPNGSVKTYFSETPLLDAAALLREARSGVELYCCGPAPLMQAVKDASAHWPSERVHFEYFSAPPAQWPDNEPFEVELARSGEVLQVPADRSILQVVRERGIDVHSACEEGVCGTCETAVLAGVPQHRDMLLSAAEKASGRSMMICVSRAARGSRLVLDL